MKFQYKDYSDQNKVKQMVLSSGEFIRRFGHHILPKGFVKMRHYGILGNSNRKKRINDILKKMNLPLHPPTVKIPCQLRMLEKYGVDVNICPSCSQGRLVLIEKVYPGNRGSPFIFINQIDMQLRSVKSGVHPNGERLLHCSKTKKSTVKNNRTLKKWRTDKK